MTGLGQYGAAAVAAGVDGKALRDQKPESICDQLEIAGEHRGQLITQLERLKEGPTKMKIFYGSQSGTAEGFAFEMEKEAKQYFFDAEVVDLEEYEPEELSDENLVVFLVATHGEGEPTDNAVEFYEWMTGNEHDDDELAGLQFAVFGLGNTQYEFFCKMGTEFDERITKMGADRLVDAGTGDDDKDIEQDWEDWRAGFWKAASQKFNGWDVTGADNFFENDYEITWVCTGDDCSSKEVEEARALEFPKRVTAVGGGFVRAYTVPVAESKDLCSPEFTAKASSLQGKLVKHVEFDIKKVSLRYRTAHNLGFVVPNHKDQVRWLCKRFGVAPNAVFRLEKKDKESKGRLTIPTPCTAEHALTWYVDINGAPKKRFFYACAQFAEDGAEGERVRDIGGGKIPDKLKYRNAVNTLRDFPSAKMSFLDFMELQPKLQPRYYTIASSHKVHPDRIGATVVLEHAQDTDGSRFRGVASSFMTEMEAGTMCKIFVKKSVFLLPRKKVLPVIMIGPGTGIAPFRAFVQEGNYLKKEGNKLGEWHLFFGCRHKEHDFLYRELLESSLNDGGCLTHLHTAFSRDGPKKVYVQHLLEEQGEKLWELINKRRGYVYVCGATPMGADVRSAFEKIFQKYGGKDETQAAQYLRSLMGSKRYTQELWG